MESRSEKILSFVDKVALFLAISSGPVIAFASNKLRPYLMFLAIVPAIYLAIRAFKIMKRMKQREKSLRPFKSFYNLNLWVQLIINTVATFGNFFGGIYFLLTDDIKEDVEKKSWKKRKIKKLTRLKQNFFSLGLIIV